MSVMISLHDRLWRNGLLGKAYYDFSLTCNAYFIEIFK